MTFTGIILAFFFLGLCIFIHELGHFLVAKWRGLHIVAFSIGFKKIWGFKHKGIDYRIGCIPCGGYVDLPQIDATGEPKDENGNPLPPAKPIDRILTAFSGPLFNILFGIVLSVFVWWIGVPQDTPNMRSITVQEVEQNSPEYKAGLRAGDVITKLNGQNFNCSWGDFVRSIIFTEGDVKLEIKRDGKKIEIKYRPIPNEKRTPNEKIAYPFFTPLLPLECEVKPGSTVAKSGMKDGDIIIKLNGQKMTDTEELRTTLGMNTGESIQFTVKRNGKIIDLEPITPKGEHKQIFRTGIMISDSFNAMVANLKPQALPGNENEIKVGDFLIAIDGKTVDSEYMLGRTITKKNGKPVYLTLKRGKDLIKVSKIFPIDKDNKDQKIDLEITYKYSMPFWINGILPGAPAEKQGFKQYDRLLKINDQKVSDFKFFLNTISNSKGKPLPVVIERDGKVLEKNLTPKAFYPYSAESIGLRLVITSHPTPWYQFSRVITMTYKSLRGIFSKDSTLKARHLSGPIGIIRGIGITFSHGGIMSVLALIVLITYSLAILNIMPLPVLDGGHIVLALIEQIFGKPLSPKIVQPLFVLFITLLITMMIYVTFYDAQRFRSKSLSSKTIEYRFLQEPNTDK